MANNGYDYEADGGVFSNNPSLVAYDQVRLAYPHHQYLFVSLRTGLPDEHKVEPPAAFESSGVIEGLIPTLKIALTSHFLLTQIQIRFRTEQGIFPGGDYFRYNIRLTEDKRLFDVSAKNIQNIQIMGQDMIRENQERINQLVTLLKKIKS